MKQNFVSIIILLVLGSCGPDEQTAAKASSSSPHEQSPQGLSPPESGPAGTRKLEQPSHEFTAENGASAKSTPKTSCAKVRALKSQDHLNRFPI